jgi:hypothetical protein
MHDDREADSWIHDGEHWPHARRRLPAAAARRAYASASFRPSASSTASLRSVARVVAIDIKPSSKLNRINPRRGGVISVTILSTSTFDATSVDPESVVFGPEEAGAIREQEHIRDANGDGQLDLVLFKIRKTGIECGDTSASLSGKTFDGEAIQGIDAITTVGCRRHTHDGRRSERH